MQMAGDGKIWNVLRSKKIWAVSWKVTNEVKGGWAKGRQGTNHTRWSWMPSKGVWVLF